MFRTIVCLFVVVMPQIAAADQLLTTINGSYTGILSDYVETYLGLSTARFDQFFRLPLADGVYELTEEISPTIEALSNGREDYWWQVLMPATTNHWTGHYLDIYEPQLWQTVSYCDNGGCFSIVPTVASLNGIDLAGTGHVLRRIETTLSDVSIVPITYPDWDGMYWSHSVNFQIALYGLPEPSALALATPLMVLALRRSRRRSACMSCHSN